MARYRQLMVGDDTRWHLMSPTGPLEALRIAWMLWRYPERVAALVGVRNEYVLATIGEGSDPMTSDPVDPVESSSGVPMDDFHPVESDAEALPLGSTASVLTLEQKRAANVWDHVDDALAVIELARAGRWTWLNNSRCKYVELRIDMRDGGCVIKDREGRRIDPEMLRKQISDEPHAPWPTKRMPLGDWQKAVAALYAAPQAPNSGSGVDEAATG